MRRESSAFGVFPGAIFKVEIAQIFVKLLFALLEIIEPRFLPLAGECILGPEGVKEQHHCHQAAKGQTQSFAHCLITSLAAGFTTNPFMDGIHLWCGGRLCGFLLADGPVPNQEYGTEQGSGRNGQSGIT